VEDDALRGKAMWENRTSEVGGGRNWLLYKSGHCRTLGGGGVGKLVGHGGKKSVAWRERRVKNPEKKCNPMRRKENWLNIKKKLPDEAKGRTLLN